MTAYERINDLFISTQGIEWGNNDFNPYDMEDSEPEAVALYNRLFDICGNVEFNDKNTLDALRFLSTEWRKDRHNVYNNPPMDFIGIWNELEYYDMTVTVLPDDINEYFQEYTTYIVSYSDGYSLKHFLAKVN